MESLFFRLAAALATPDISSKLTLTASLADDWKAGRLDWRDPTPVDLVCGRPEKPELVPPKLVPQRSPTTEEGRARLLHAIVHIEFSAINLALDHAARFRGLPEQYYTDWIGVAADEAYHFSILRERLNSLGYDYGDFPAHAGLWEMAMKTADDPLARMALVPRLLEAAGWMPRRPSSAGWSRLATTPAPVCWTSSCATRSAMSASATTGFANCATRATWSRKALTVRCCGLQGTPTDRADERVRPPGSRLFTGRAGRPRRKSVE